MRSFTEYGKVNGPPQLHRRVRSGARAVIKLEA